MSQCVTPICTDCPFEYFCTPDIKESRGNVLVVYSPDTKEPEKVFKRKRDAIKYINEQRSKSLFDFYTYKEMETL